MKTIFFTTVMIYAGLAFFQQGSHSTVQPSSRDMAGLSDDGPGYRDHDFHVSKCLVEYNEREQALQMSLHIFIDDLEEALRRQGNDKLFICTRKEHEQAEQYMASYLRQHFSFEVNGKPIGYTFIGKEVSEDLAAVWCYLEITGVSRLESLQVTNSLLMDVFDDQKNLVSITGPEKQQGLLLFQKGDTVKEVGF